MQYVKEYNDRHFVPIAGAYDRWRKDFREYPILYLQGQIGWGKTVSAVGFAKQHYRNWQYLSVTEEEFTDKLMQFWEQLSDRRISSLLIVDDLQWLNADSVIEELANILSQVSARKKKMHVMLISRAGSPAYLQPFVVTRQMCIEYGKCLIPSREEIGKILKKEGLEADNRQIELVEKATTGYMLGIALAVNWIKHGITDEKELKEKVHSSIYDYLDVMLIPEWEEDIMDFLLRIAAVEQFDLELARRVTGEWDSAKMMERIKETGSYVIIHSGGWYEIEPFFRRYLLKRQQEKLGEMQYSRIYEEDGAYYEEKKQYDKALDCYAKTEMHSKVTKLLIQNFHDYGGGAYYRAVEAYYKKIPEAMIDESPELLAAIALMYSMKGMPEESDRYIQKVHNLARRLPSSDERKQAAVEKEIYLSFAVPHTGNKGLPALFINLARLCTQKGIALKAVSATGMMPSLLNGGKDFCTWMGSADIFYRTLKRPIEQVLGKSGIGLADTAMGECLYEKNELTRAVEYLTKGISEASMAQQLPMEYAATGVMAKLFLAEGSIDTARVLLKNMELKAAEEQPLDMKHNIRASQVRIALREGAPEQIERWTTEEKDHLSDFYSADRYLLATKARVYIWQGKYMEAEAVLQILYDYSVRYSRIYIQIETELLKAIIRYRREEEWQDLLLAALQKARKYHLVRIVADEGSALLPLWEALKESKKDWNIEKKWCHKTEEALKKQAELYPTYLIHTKDQEELSFQELQMLKLLEQGKSNKEIAGEIGFSVANVKYHLGNIYKKLEANNRITAVAKARDRKMI